MKIKSVQTLVSEALEDIKTITSDEALKMYNENQCNLIDIRDIRELQKKVELKVPTISQGMLEFG